MTEGLHVIFGTGPLGLAVMRALHGRGRRVRAVNRSGRANVPAGVDVVAVDATDRAAARRVCQDAAVVYPANPQALQLIHVRHSGSSPERAFVAIRYRQHWFAIADTDIDSKDNFGLLLTILSLQTTGAGAAPGLTLPVGR